MARIIKLERIKPERIRLYFEDGAVREYVPSRYASKGTVFEPLADRTYSLRCRLVHGGGGLAWPNNADIDADSLRRMGRAVGAEKLASSATKPEPLPRAAASK